MTQKLAIFKSFFLYFALLIAAMVGLVWPLIQGYEDGLKAQVLIGERALQTRIEQLVHKEIFERSGDLRVLSKAPPLINFLRHPDAANRRVVEDSLTHVADAYRIYLQLRLLDMQGNERIRINFEDGKAQVVKPANLQNKADRYYFKEAVKLQPGQIYISPLDLNVEHGRVQVPYQSTLRLAAPVVGDTGATEGVLVLNYDGSRLLGLIREVDRAKLCQTMLVNSEGDWMSHPDSSMEWGRQLQHPQNNFGKVFPKVWPLVHGQEAGEVTTPQGVFLYQRFMPLDFAAEPLSHGLRPEQVGFAHSEVREYHWHLVTLIPPEMWLSRSLFRQPWAWGGLAVVVLVALVGLWSLAQRRVLKRRLAVERLHAQEILNDLYENAPCGYHSVDAQGLVQRMNQTELGWLGYQRDEVVGKVNFMDLVAPECRDDIQQCFQQFLQEGQVQDHSTQLLRKDGQRIAVSLSATAQRNAQGQVVSSRTTVLDVTERQRLERELEREARTDSLTGVYNRRQFNLLAERELSRARREGKPLSLLMVDIDWFKKINDRHGHSMGDQALKAVAETCGAQLRGHDVFARMGGEEFAALLTQSGAVAAAQVAERIRAAVEGLVLPVDGGESMRVTVSVGVACDETGQLDLEGLLKRADANLYRAKDAGRNQVCT